MKEYEAIDTLQRVVPKFMEMRPDNPALEGHRLTIIEAMSIVSVPVQYLFMRELYMNETMRPWIENNVEMLNAIAEWKQIKARMK